MTCFFDERSAPTDRMRSHRSLDQVLHPTDSIEDSDLRKQTEAETRLLIAQRSVRVP